MDAKLAAFRKDLRQVDMKSISKDCELLTLDYERMGMEPEKRKADRELRKQVDLKKFKLMMETLSSAMNK